MDCLDQYFQDTRSTPAHLAKAMGASSSPVYRVIKGERPPNVRMADKVEVATAGRITAEQFMSACMLRHRAFASAPSGSVSRLRFRRGVSTTPSVLPFATQAEDQG
jgi:hypothetical protein